MQFMKLFPVIFLTAFVACAAEGIPTADSTTVVSTVHLTNYSDLSAPHLIKAGPELVDLGSFLLYGTGLSSIGQIELSLQHTSPTLDGRQLGNVELFSGSESIARADIAHGKIILRPLGRAAIVYNEAKPIFNVRGRVLNGTLSTLQFQLTKVIALDTITGHQVTLTTDSGQPQSFPIPLRQFTLREGRVISSLIKKETSFPPIVSSDYAQQLLAIFRLTVYGEYAQLSEITLDLTLTGFTADKVKDLTVEDDKGTVLGSIIMTSGGSNPHAVFRPNYTVSSWANQGKPNTNLYVSAKILNGAEGSVQAKMSARAMGIDSQVDLPIADVAGDIIPVTK